MVIAPPLSLFGALFLLLAEAPPGPAQEPAARSAPAPAATAPASAAPRKVWTAADLARLGRGGVSVSGTGEASSPQPAGAAASVPRAGEPPDWSRGAALRQVIAAGSARIAAIEELQEQWGRFVLGTGSFQATAAHEIAELREQRRALQDQVARARAELDALEEAARKAGVAPGALR